MEKTRISMLLPLVLMMIALILGLSYVHETELTTEVRDEVSSGMAAISDDN